MTPDQKKAEAKKLIVQLVTDTLSEAEGDRLVEEIEKLVPDPDITKYIFWSIDFEDEDENLDIDAVLKKAFSYKPIAL